jgi:hypothetical protein
VIAINRRVLASASTAGRSALSRPTTVQFGPDGRPYVGQLNGYIHALTLDANRNVVAAQRIDTIHDSPNFDADGSPSTVTGRLLVSIVASSSAAGRPKVVPQPYVTVVQDSPKPASAALTGSDGVGLPLSEPWPTQSDVEWNLRW